MNYYDMYYDMYYDFMKIYPLEMLLKLVNSEKVAIDDIQNLYLFPRMDRWYISWNVEEMKVFWWRKIMNLFLIYLLCFVKNS